MNDTDRNTNPIESQKLTALGLTRLEVTRATFLLAMEILSLIFSPLAGGFHMKTWSMLDSALLVIAIGVTSLIYVLESPHYRRAALYTAITFYMLAIVDMSVNILISGWLGWVDI